jgi:peptidoglycan/LPS O-acetylase OafA/YrhL
MSSGSSGAGSARLTYTPALDGVRGVSVLAVIGYHAFGFPSGGFIGVEFFFVLSGFLITTLLLQEREETGGISLRAFYRRRVLRLLPALIVVVAAYLVISAIRFSVGDPAADGGLLKAGYGAAVGLTYVSNAAIAWHGNLPPGIQHLWSLAQEEQFYLVWPVALLLFLRFRASKAALFAFALAGVLAVDLHRLQLTIAGASERRLYGAPDTAADAILVGCILGILYSSGTLGRLVGRPLWRRVVAPLGALAVIAAAFLVPNTDYRPLYEWLFPLVVLGGAVVIAGAACDAGGLMTRTLSSRWLVGQGRISYGLYLWHPLFLYALGISLPLPAVVAAFVAARLSYTYVEQPFLRRRRRPLPTPSRRASSREKATEGPPRPAPIREAPVVALESEA